MSADPEQEYFCDGMAEDVINALAHVEGLQVAAPEWDAVLADARVQALMRKMGLPE